MNLLKFEREALLNQFEINQNILGKSGGKKHLETFI